MQSKSTRRPRHKASVKQRWLPIDSAPLKVREHGLRDAHSHPLVSPGKIDGHFAASFRVEPWAAWSYFPSLELRAENSYPALILDFDGRGSFDRVMEAVRLAKVGALNWAVENRRTGGVHGVWTLAKPVHRAEMALEAPLKLFTRISEYYAARLDADAGYTGVLTHNPMEDAQLAGFVTHWLRRPPYGLGELAEFIPFRWRRPKPSRTAVGRNCDVFCHCMRWAGSPANLASPVFPEARRVNDGYDVPLDAPEVAGIARSVERYRRRWIKQGRFYSKVERMAWGRERGIKSGEARRKRTAERDRAIVQLALAGTTQRAIARVTGVDEKMVRHILRRDAPLFGRPASLTETRPWEAEGISKATWYRRRETNAERTTQVSTGK